MIDWNALIDLDNEVQQCHEYDLWMYEWSGNPAAPTPPLKPVLYGVNWQLIEELIFQYYTTHKDGLDNE